MRNLIFHRRVTLHAGDGDDVHVQRGQLRQRGQGGLQANGGKLRVDADGEIVGHHFQYIVADFLRIAAVVGQPLQVGNQDKLLVFMLKLNALAQRTGIVSKM